MQNCIFRYVTTRNYGKVYVLSRNYGCQDIVIVNFYVILLPRNYTKLHKLHRIKVKKNCFGTFAKVKYKDRRGKCAKYINLADLAGMGRKLRQYNIFWYVVQARLSAHIDCMIFAHYPCFSSVQRVPTYNTSTWYMQCKA